MNSSASALSSKRTSSEVISSRPACWVLVDALPFRPLLCPWDCVSMVSLPSILEMYSCVVVSLPPKYSRLSQLPGMVSQVSLNSALICARFCMMMDAEISRLRMVARHRSKSSGSATLANSSSIAVPRYFWQTVFP